jgi:L-arabinokinase
MLETYPIVYYVSSHGYGHGVRSCDIIRALHEIRPDLPICIVTCLPDSFLINRLGPGPRVFRSAAFDLGMVQKDSIRVDVPATLREIEVIYGRRDVLVDEEAAFLRAHRVRAVVADIPAMPLEAAARVGCHRIAVGNFGWNWIYSAFVREDRRWEPIVQAIEQGYRQAEILLRLPFSEGMSIFPNVEDIGVVASPGRNRRSEIAALTSAKEDLPWVLISFTSLEWNDEALDRVQRCKGYEFFTVLPLSWRRNNIHPIDRERIPFADVLSSVDAVVSKPGFGVISDCVVNGKPLIYADREDFLEYEVLLDAIRKYLRHVHIPAQHLYHGDLDEALKGLSRTAQPPQVPRFGGAAMAARRILDFL